MTERIGEVAVERELRVLHQGVHAEMHALHGLAPARHLLEGLIELRQSLDLDHQVKLAKARRAETQLAPRQPPSLDQSLALEMAHIGRHALRKLDVAHAG